MKALFELGQEVVCVDAKCNRPHLIPVPLVEGNYYRITAMRVCSCGQVTVDVGIKSITQFGCCPKCSMRVEQFGSWWFNQSRFAPIDHIKEIEKLKESLTITEHAIQKEASYN